MPETGTKWIQDLTRLGGESDLLGIVQVIKNYWPYFQMIYIQTRIRPKKMKPLKFSVTLSKKRITQFWAEYTTKF